VLVHVSTIIQRKIRTKCKLIHNVLSVFIIFPDLPRDKLIGLAFLTGSDYTEGLRGNVFS